MGVKVREVEGLISQALKWGWGVPFYNISVPVLNRCLVFFFFLICFDPAPPFPFSTCMSYSHLWFFPEFMPRALGTRGSCSHQLADRCWRGPALAQGPRQVGNASRPAAKASVPWVCAVPCRSRNLPDTSGPTQSRERDREVQQAFCSMPGPGLSVPLRNVLRGAPAIASRQETWCEHVAACPCSRLSCLC